MEKSNMEEMTAKEMERCKRETIEIGDGIDYCKSFCKGMGCKHIDICW
jgi:hypothetical protein